MNHRRLRKGPRIVLTLITVVALIGVAWRFVPQLFARPTFTLFIHSADAGRDPARIIASVHAGSAKVWSQLVAHPEMAEKLLWMEKVDGAASQRLFGSHAIRDSELIFTPASPLVPGAMYHVVFVPPGLSENTDAAVHTGFGSVSGKGRLELIHQVPESAKIAAPIVRSIHPSANVLPANQLKFYITFSEPMEQGVFMERIKLLRGDGSEISGPFRETELWSPDGKRLTVWLHPGRQKTGVNLNEDEGAVLRENESVTLQISGEWRAASGQKIGTDFKRPYHVAKADRAQPHPMRWSIHYPQAGTREPLVIMFPEPLDWALLQNCLSIMTVKDSVIEGQIDTADGEREWWFIPKSAWSAGEFYIKVSTFLEDLAGNSLERPFEVDVADAPPQPPLGSVLLLFRIE